MHASEDGQRTDSFLDSAKGSGVPGIHDGANCSLDISKGLEAVAPYTLAT